MTALAPTKRTFSEHSFPERGDLPTLKSHPLIYGNVLDLIADTPLLKLPPSDDAPQATVWGKLEAWNPGGSVKDRICLAIIEDAEKRGLLTPGGTVVEPTSGNTGVGLAMVCRRKGYRCVLTMPQSMSLERRALLELMGAEVVLTPPEEQMNGAIRRAEAIALELEASGKNAFVPRQFDNQANPLVHEHTTGPEIVHALGELAIAAFVAGVGTGGTITGVGRYLKRQRPGCRIVGVEPESCPTLTTGQVGPTKIQGLAAGFVPENFDRSIVDEIRLVADRDAYDTKRALGRRSGILVGISAGAAVHAAYAVARSLKPEQHVVVVLPDTGERYFSLDEYFKPKADVTATALAAR
jgi:cysteine synthase